MASIFWPRECEYYIVSVCALHCECLYITMWLWVCVVWSLTLVLYFIVSVCVLHCEFVYYIVSVSVLHCEFVYNIMSVCVYNIVTVSMCVLNC